MDKINTKELKVIETVLRNSETSQRDISSETGLSLGLTNIMINRLIKKGYLKAKKLNPRKVRYMVTPKGLREKTKKSYRFMKRSFEVMSGLRGMIMDYAEENYKQGIRDFVIKGNGELSEITELVLNSLALENANVRRAAASEEINSGTIVFNTAHEHEEENKESRYELNLWKEAEKLYGGNYEF